MSMINFMFKGLPGRAEILPDETYVTWGGAGFQIAAAPPAMRAAIARSHVAHLTSTYSPASQPMNPTKDVINGTYRTNANGETERKCPQCGAWANADHVDNGIGAEQCGPYGCERCGWVEQRQSIETLFR